MYKISMFIYEVTNNLNLHIDCHIGSFKFIEKIDIKYIIIVTSIT